MTAATLQRGAPTSIRQTLLINVVVPVLVFRYLVQHGHSEFTALAVSAAVPAAAIAFSAVSTRRLEPIAALVLSGIVAGLIGGALFGPHVLLVKDSFITGGIGIACLLSLLSNRPLFWRLANYFVAQGIESKPARNAPDSWHYRMTGVWGIALIAEASIRVAVSFVVSPAMTLALSPLLAAAVIAPLVFYTRRARPRDAAQPAYDTRDNR